MQVTVSIERFQKYIKPATSTYKEVKYYYTIPHCTDYIYQYMLTILWSSQIDNVLHRIT